MISAGGIPHSGTKIDGARVDIGSTNLKLLVMTAYAVRSQQISGPDWMTLQRFDILATMPAGAAKEQLPEMLQSLLAERFKLAARRVAREQDVFALVIGKGGLKMETAAADADFSGSKEPLLKGTPGNAEGLSGTVNGPGGPADAASEPGGDSIFKAVEKLGLKLEARRAPVENIVIDHLEKTPTEN